MKGAIEFGLPETISRTPPVSAGALGGSLLAHGKPGLFYPAHLLATDCGANSPVAFPYYSGKFLWQLPRYQSVIADRLSQPVSLASHPVIGYTQTWDNNANHKLSSNAGYDLAWASAGGNTIDRDNDLGVTSVGSYAGSADALETDGYIYGNTARTNGVIGPYQGQEVYVFTSDYANTGWTIKSAYVIDVDRVVGAWVSCNGVNIFHYAKHNVIIQSANGVKFVFGDSGSVIASAGFGGDLPDYYVGMINWVVTSSDPVQDRIIAGGQMYKSISEGLKLEDGLSTLGPAEFQPTSVWDKVPSVVTSHATVTLDHWLSPRESFATSTVKEVCVPHYVWNKSTIAWAVGVATEIDEQAVPAPPTSNRATFRYINPTGGVNTPYKIALNTTLVEQVCLYNANQTDEQTYVLNTFGINARSAIQKRALNTILAKWTTAGTDHTFEISAATNTNTDTVHIPGAFGTAKFVITIKNVGTTIQGDHVAIGLSTRPSWNEANIPSLQLALCQTLDGVNCFYWNTNTHQRVFDNSDTTSVWR